MDIRELLESFKTGEADKQEVGESLCSPAETPVTEAWTTPPEVFVPAVVATAPVVEVPETAPVETPVPPVVVAPVKHVTKTTGDKRGRPVLYDTSTMEVGDFLVYHGKLASGRVLASLNGNKETGRKFQATETDVEIVVDGSYAKVTEVHITRKA